MSSELVENQLTEVSAVMQSSVAQSGQQLADLSLLYIRYAFPMATEPGPKRHLDLVHYLQDKGCEVTVVTCGANYMTGERASGQSLLRKTEYDGIPILSTFSVASHRKSPARRILNYIAFAAAGFLAALKWKPKHKRRAVMADISPVFATLPAYLLSLLRRNTNLVLEITDIPESIFAVRAVRNKLFEKMIMYYVRKIYRRGAILIALTKGAKRHLENQGVPLQKVVLVSNWVGESDNAFSSREIEDIRRELGWQKKFVLLYVGGMGYAYDIMTILKSAKFLQDLPNVLFAFAGEGERRKSYEEFCRENDLPNCVFLPWQPRARLGLLIQAANVGLNAFYGDPFWNIFVGHKIFDYFDNGCPILFSGGGETAEMISLSGGGLSVTAESPEHFAQAVRALATQPERTKNMGIAAREFMRSHFKREVILSNLARELESLA
jgi:colanic acid biosynthesis glycosyl transferase WcaI